MLIPFDNVWFSYFTQPNADRKEKTDGKIMMESKFSNPCRISITYLSVVLSLLEYMPYPFICFVCVDTNTMVTVQ